MNTDWVGKSVNLDCGPLGFYQGLIQSLNLKENTITLEKAFLNGRAANVPDVTLRAADIKDLQFIESKQVPGGSDSKAASTVKVAKKKAKPTSANPQLKLVQAARFSPAIAAALPGTDRLVGGTNQRSSPRKGLDCSTASPGRFTPGGGGGGGRRDRVRQRDEDCFGSLDPVAMAQDFDFERNLALFDKRQVFDAIEGEMATAVTAALGGGSNNQPDVVRLVDCNRRRGKEEAAIQPKYRNDENVLVTAPAQYRPITTSEMPPPGEYVTDTGLIVPAVSGELREKLEKVADAKGLGLERVTELIARAATDLAVQLFGGAHRLNPDNSHQVPQCVVLCGPNRAGAFGMASARHLASQGVRVVAYLPDLPHYPEHLDKEFKLLKLAGAKWTTKTDGLPISSVDLVISALEDHEMWQQERCQPWLTKAVQWAKNSARSPPVLSLDPPAEPAEAVLPTKISLLPGMPLWFEGESDGWGKLYMANLAVPKKIYQAAGIKYASPFGAKTVIPLHRVT